MADRVRGTRLSRPGRLSGFRRHRAAVAGLVVLVALAGLAFVGPLVWIHPYDALDQPLNLPFAPGNPMGTDSLGHDHFARVLRGMRQSLTVAFVVAVLSTGIGAPYGAIAGYAGGAVNAVMMRICDVLLTLPLLLVAGALISGGALAGGPLDGAGDATAVALVLGLIGWVVNARVVRGVVLSLRDREFVVAARALGAGPVRILLRHLLPNAAGAIIVQATLDVAAAILAESALSFLGLGVRPPDTSLGLLVNEYRSAAQTRPWLFYWPGAMIILIALSVNFVGDGLRAAFDPRRGT